ncbi:MULTISPECIES: hypothetical protein [unclassified Anabaena]|uniref:hypothetical protein n=1 Tax=unclassified Anabaena TaxID=2619674 RepID=UPI0014484922|nr:MULTISPECIES: hypothetical protein [unclassified Anabaena]MTJ06759.1 hypothetical protein [Anabaena sp. UHCC 0204]MTJ55004.1 hypothetical protein [Anabaena sp. UHCC 0253]
MVDRINDIAWQAHQGSVAAIIQVLNERLVVSGVRTRAILADGVLQLLCEAATVDQLEQSILVQKIQEILESIAPRNIRKVNINSRIVREEQLLWLEEINDEGENKLLWCQQIILTQPNFFKQLIQDLTEFYRESGKPTLPQFESLIKNKNKHKRLVKTAIVGVSGLCSLILLLWLVRFWLDDTVKNLTILQEAQVLKQGNQTKPDVLNRTGNQSLSTPSDVSPDLFADAVRLANQASAAGKTAITSTQWLELAATWQRASDLMSQVSPSHSRYREAQIRTKLYKKFSEAAEKEADKSEL